MIRGGLFLAALFLSVAGSPAGPAERGRNAAVPSPGEPVDLRIETIRVGASGTETLHTDEARVLPGQGAVLEREITLEGRVSGRAAAKEKLHLHSEARVVSISESTATVRLSSRLRILASSAGGPLPSSDVTRQVTAEVGEGTSHLFEVYESPSLGVKITLVVRWGRAEADPGGGSEAVPIPLIVRVYDPEDSSGGLLSENRLLARLGGGASTSFNRTVPLPDTGSGERRVRQDSLDITVSPQFQGGRVLEVVIEAAGIIATLEPEKRTPHPLSHRGRYVLSPGIPASLDLEVAGNPTGEEGWTRVRFRLEVLATF